MHELPIAQNILEISLRNAEQAGAKKVLSINLVIGRLSSAVDDSIQFYWEMIAEGTIAQGATLHFERIPAEMRCLDCQHTFHPDDRAFACPNCQGIRVRIIKGDELRVDSIDIE